MIHLCVHVCMGVLTVCVCQVFGGELPRSEHEKWLKDKSRSELKELVFQAQILKNKNYSISTLYSECTRTLTCLKFGTCCTPRLFAMLSRSRKS